MRIIICDDDRDYCEKLKKTLYSFVNDEFEGIIEIHYTAKAMKDYCTKNIPDIVFLDIELGDMNGIDLAKYIKCKCPETIIIYITNHPNYVFSSFETEPLNFLRKPIHNEELHRTFKRATEKYLQIHRTISIKWQNESVNLEIKDICYIESYKRHLTFNLYNGDRYEVVGKLKDVYELLKIYGFVKSHQGFIVNMLYIKDFGENEINMKNGDTVLMSVRRRLSTKETYTNYINRR